MSKSTSTGVVTSPDENLNPKKKQTCATGQPTLSYLSSRSVELKDISNSPLTTHDSHPSRKLIIPLEPDLSENDWGGITGSFSPVKIERVSPVQFSESAKKRVAKLSRSRTSKSKVRYTMEGPQPSLMNWVKKSDPLCIDKGGNGDGIVAIRMDEVDGDKKLQEKRMLGMSTSDEYLGDDSANNYSPRSRRSHKMYKDPDFVYDNSVKCKKVLLIEDDDSCNVSHDSSFSTQSFKKRKLSSTDSCALSPKKKSKTQSKCQNVTTKIGLKKSKQPVKSRKLKNSQSRRIKQNPRVVQTMHDFFTSINNNNNNSNCSSDEDVDEIDQEEKDRLLAQELQRQFELEAKLNLSALRFKGSSEEYSLRKTRKPKEIADA
jgi:hypothetical protein